MNKTYRITGMHCPACVLSVKKAIDAVPGVLSADVNPSGHSAIINFDTTEPDLTLLVKAVSNVGYELSDGLESPKNRRSIRDWLIGGLSAGAFILLYLVVQRTGIIGSFSPGAADISPFLGFGTGLVASVSTCFALVGSFVLALGQSARKSDHPFRNALVSTTTFHLGRILAFAGFGAVLGLVGGSLRLSGTALGWYTIAAALVIGLSGLSILGIRIPLFSSRRIASLMDRLSLSRSPFTAAGLGALTFFLPCGFTLSMQAIALSSRSSIDGALVLGSFALGTLPVLFAAGLGSAYIGHKNLFSLRIAAGILVVGFAGITAASGLSLSRFSGDLFSQSGTGSSAAELPVAAADAQVVEMHVTYQGFEPSTLTIEAGRPVEWVIWGDEVTGCTNRIIIPSLGIKKAVKPGRNVVTFTAPEPGDLPFSCWMGMVRGVFKVSRR
jgi:sulfite exporter TauE/SafE/copper chaperone CopZ